MRAAPRLFSIPPGEAFLDVLVERLLDGTIVPGFPEPDDPLALARATVLLPTRRACRALEDAFLRRNRPALLLPRIRPIGDLDEDDLLLAGAEGAEPDGAVDLPPTVRPLQRRLVLTRLVLAWLDAAAAGGAPVSPRAGEAAHLASELARLMDTVATEGVGWDVLRAILPEGLQDHWAVTLDFLQIATRHWPAHLAEAGLIEPAERRRLLLEAEAARLARDGGAPVVAAGSTGSIPATAALLGVVARLPRGAVVLPGLDRDLDAAAWSLLARDPGAGSDPVPSHPQATMAALLQRFGLRRDEVRHLGGGAGPRERARERLLGEAMRPAEATEAWSTVTVPPEALDDVALVEAANEHEEALAVACLLREALEAPGRTAALITPDRTLARRVAAELARFGVEVDDTAGQPLGESPAGLLLRLLGDAGRDASDPVALLALLQHPLVHLGQARASVRDAARALERLVLRGPELAPGLDGLLAAAAADAPGTQAGRGLSPGERAEARRLADALAAALRPLEAVLAGTGRRPLAALLAVVEATLDAVVASPDGGDALQRSPDGRSLRQFLAELGEGGAERLAVPPDEMPELLAALMAGTAVPRSGGAEPRLRIYGLLEARLVRHDRVVLAGLNEGVWPAATRTDPWLSRTMRGEMGLPAPERRIGLSAHDFVQALGTREAFLLRSLRAGGAPTVPSRWLQRLGAVCGTDIMAGLRRRGAAVLAMARSVDAVAGLPRPVARPEPRPPLEARPFALSVTEIETLVRDPYSIYARHVLRLRPWEGLAEEPAARERGTVIHEALNAFAEEIGRGAAIDEARLVALGEQLFAERFAAYPELTAFWWPRFRRIAHWYAGFEAGRRENGALVLTERPGRLVFDVADGRPFTLRGRADRFERHADGTFSVLDFKTGRVPGANEVAVGFAPQLALEAAMAALGAFEGVPAGLTPAELVYVGLRGGEPAGKAEHRGPKDGDVEGFVMDQLAEAKTLIRGFARPDQPYLSLAASQWALQYGDYDHLARVREWGLAEEEDA